MSFLLSLWPNISMYVSIFFKWFLKLQLDLKNMNFQLSLRLNVRTSRWLVTIAPRFTIWEVWTICHNSCQGGWTKCHKWQLVHLPRGEKEKFVDIMIQGLKRCGLKSSRVQLSQGPTMWVKLSLGLKVGGLNVKAPKFHCCQKPALAKILGVWKLIQRSLCKQNKTNFDTKEE